ncbi:hypothetical protein GCM10022277_09210 [Litoribacillus peritrichatus]|uniref:Prepilin-type N-terminal cleavage/methylation domain-containing protein n=2 Tax=Litoribacillus peritrichatus TaxID=718191 RepID=A0ABP7M7T3_9GAMM
MNPVCCNRSTGFTLIELVMVIVILGVLAAFALPKFASLENGARILLLQSFKGIIQPAADIANAEIMLRPQNKSTNQTRYDFDNGDQIRIRADYPDGRWNNTFAILVDWAGYDIGQVSNNNCTDADFEWCVRQRGLNWFVNRGYTSASAGRGFVIFPRGNNLNNDECYVYYFTPNPSGVVTIKNKPVTGIVTTDC